MTVLINIVKRWNLDDLNIFSHIILSSAHADCTSLKTMVILFLAPLKEMMNSNTIVLSSRDKQTDSF